MATSTTSSDSFHEKELECKEIIIQQPHWRPECCIYKVPKRLRGVKMEAYTPKLISIGPVHRDMVALNEMENLKKKYFQEFFQRPWKCQAEFENIVQKNEDNIRHCYAPDISLPKREVFVEMVLLDSIFIIELFMRTAKRKECGEDDFILSKPWLDEGIKNDLILLENQLPFFILDELHRHIGRSTSSHESFCRLACTYFYLEEKKIPIEKEVKHFTDLQRYFYIPPNLKTGKIIEHLRSATKLDSAGLKFQVGKENQALLDIQVKKPNPSEIFPRFNCSWLLPCLPCLKCFWCLDHLQTRLVVPHFVIKHGTEDLFRNLMALEQCHYPLQAYICNYIMLLDFLINTREDAELLVEKKIIVHSLGSYKAVALMVNKLGQEIVENNSCYHDVAEDLNDHYGNRWNKNIASLRTVYFRDVWRGTATFAGIVVLFVTVGNFLRPFVFHK